MTSTATETTDAVKTETNTTIDGLKSILTSLNEQALNTKALMNTIRQVIKEHDKQSKELEKLRNKRSRVKSERSANSLPSGITKPVAITDELAKFLGVAPGTLVPRNEVTKGVSGFVKQNGLSDPENKQKFVLDDRPAAKQLRVLLGNPSEAVTYFNLQRYLKQHYLPMPATEAKPKAVVVDTPLPASTAEPVKKKILVKKVVKKELSEDVTA